MIYMQHEESFAVFIFIYLFFHRICISQTLIYIILYVVPVNYLILCIKTVGYWKVVGLTKNGMNFFFFFFPT